MLRTAVGTAASFPSSLAEYDLERAEDAPARRAARVIQAVAPLTASLLFVAYVLIAALTVPPASADVVCGNESIREAQTSETLPSGTTYLPDCMALEMVSPPQKGAQNAKGPAVSADGARVKFVSIAALGGTPGVFAVGGDPYVASRGSSGWTTAATAPPGGMFRAGWEHYVPALSFTPDFSGWFQIASTLPQLDAGTSQAFRGGLGGFFAALSPPMTPLVIDEFSRFIVEETKFQGASADHSHLYFVPGPEAAATTTAYLPGDPEPNGNGADHNTYVARPGPVGEPSLELLARDRDDKIWGGSCGARVGGLTQGFVSAAHNGQRNQGAISADGSRVYLSARPAQPVSGDCDADANKLRILERLESSEGVQIEELFSSECSRVSPPCSGEGDDLYQGASVDGTKVYFTTNRQLADSDLDSGGECSLTAANPGCDLYLYDSGLPAGQRLVQVSAGAGGPTPGDGANVYNGIAAVSGDGSHAYFVAQGVLTGENAEHKSPTAGQPNLYLYERDAAHPSGRTAFVGTLDSGDSGGLWG
ncbi:MAG TPA: hypothetical protein VN756_01555, partial [Solirubrobacterales bacterium]|nr:hypothetical protein [Solirubrobacterales bacterium]